MQLLPGLNPPGQYPRSIFPWVISRKEHIPSAISPCTNIPLRHYPPIYVHPVPTITLKIGSNIPPASHTPVILIHCDQHNIHCQTAKVLIKLTQLSKFVINKDSVPFTTFKFGKIVLLSRHLCDKLNQSLAV